VQPSHCERFGVARGKSKDAPSGACARYRELRLESLKNHPEAFASSCEFEEEKPISWWVERLETATVFGG
jgi:hypothetical protein